MKIGRPVTRLPSVGRDRMTDPEPARAHVEHLLSIGMNTCQIARAAGITATTVECIRVGRYAEIRQMVCRALLSVTPRPHPQQVYVLNVGTRRRLDCLAWMGHSDRALAARLGVSYAFVGKLRKRNTVSWEWHKRIESLFGELWDVDGGSNRCKREARLRGALPPVAWDDLDDYYENPDRGIVRTGREIDPEKLEIRRAQIAEWTRCGLTQGEIAARLGVSIRTVERDRAVAS